MVNPSHSAIKHYVDFHGSSVDTQQPTHHNDARRTKKTHVQRMVGLLNTRQPSQKTTNPGKGLVPTGV